MALATTKRWTAKGRWEERRWVVALVLVGLGLVLDGDAKRRSPGLVHRELLGDGLHKHAELDHALLLLVLQPVGDGRRPLAKHVQPPGKSSPMPLQISHGGLLARRQRMRSMSCPCGRTHRERAFVCFPGCGVLGVPQPSLPSTAGANRADGENYRIHTQRRPLALPPGLPIAEIERRRK